ncbi:MAG: hypothetical protein IPK50_04055 [Fibrobacterota bacterium]|nr:hypothetical protein [Fibrobacterota bacterium]QQS06068.1 MAG: hypothetical protein IPK50_04055 [Fibrobacterota bacterium]
MIHNLQIFRNLGENGNPSKLWGDGQEARSCVKACRGDVVWVCGKLWIPVAANHPDF